ncbi:hypothetical protein L7F22_043445 [Adiantum nelumboides]|nr:hypothetical protein [Adiantum nelumboides]
MAPLALAGGSTGAGLSSSSLSGQKLPTLHVRTSARCPARVSAISAKHGEKNVYFDLEDIGNTTGDWDLYGSDGSSQFLLLGSGGGPRGKI